MVSFDVESFFTNDPVIEIRDLITIVVNFFLSTMSHLSQGKQLKFSLSKVLYHFLSLCNPIYIPSTKAYYKTLQLPRAEVGDVFRPDRDYRIRSWEEETVCEHLTQHS